MAELFIQWRIALPRAFRQALRHDIFNASKAVAYSGILMLFPALLVLTTILALFPEGTTLLGDIRAVSEQFLPGDIMSLVQSYFAERRIQSLQVTLSAALLSFFASLGIILSLMEGFRRAYQLPRSGWSYWQMRQRAILLVPITLIPLTLASLLIIFGHQIEFWMIDNAGGDLRAIVLFFWRMVRWAIALFTSISTMGTVYHFATRREEEHWKWVLPGSITATLVWFPTTLAFGWYVTRFADYSILYGPLGAAMATLVWLYLSAFSVLLGAEINGVFYLERIEANTQQIART